MTTRIMVKIYMLIIYTAVFYLLLPFIFLRLLWRSRKNAQYRERWLERLAWIPQQKDQPSIWVHAVSVGEVIASIPLVKALATEYPQYVIVMTTTTPTGSAQVMRSLDQWVTHFYLPYDLPACINRFIRRCRVEALVIMETELWPNLLRVTHKRHLPIIIANARLSLKSKQRYDAVKPLMKQVLSQVSMVIAQNESDAARYVDLGLPETKIKISGNIKFDLTVPHNIFVQGAKIRERIGIAKRPTVMLASTHDGEEKIWVSIIKRIKLQVPNVLLLIAPRHPERFDAVSQLLRAHGLSVARRSLGQVITQEIDVYLCDTMGELLQFYAASDVSFVGGSLVPIGGHNLIEPAALGLPIVTGHYLQNFEMVKRQLLDAQALLVLESSEAIAQSMVDLLSDREKRLSMGRRAKEVVITNNGALQRHLEIIQHYIGPTTHDSENHIIDKS